MKISHFSTIKECRIKKGLSQSALAKEIGYERSMISKWEPGVCEPPKMVVNLIEIVLGVKMGVV